MPLVLGLGHAVLRPEGQWGATEMESCWTEASLRQSLFWLPCYLFSAPLASLSNSASQPDFFFFFFCIWIFVFVFVLDSTLNPVSITWEAPLRMGLYLLCNKFLHVAERDWDRLRNTRCWSLVNTYKRKREEAKWGRERTEIQTLTKPGATLQGTLQTLEPSVLGWNARSLFIYSCYGHKLPQKHRASGSFLMDISVAHFHVWCFSRWGFFLPILCGLQAVEGKDNNPWVPEKEAGGAL